MSDPTSVMFIFGLTFIPSETATIHYQCQMMLVCCVCHTSHSNYMNTIQSIQHNIVVATLWVATFVTSQTDWIHISLHHRTFKTERQNKVCSNDDEASTVGWSNVICLRKFHRFISMECIKSRWSSVTIIDWIDKMSGIADGQ